MLAKPLPRSYVLRAGKLSLSICTDAPGTTLHFSKFTHTGDSTFGWG
jgi:hypothetical protein